MGRIEAYTHIQQRENASCSTVAMHSLLPFLPQPESITALYENTNSISDIVHVVGNEFANNGIMIQPIIMDPGARPSLFFRNVHHNLRHGNKGVQFIGGLLATQEENSQHVIAITGVHETKTPKFDIMDTAPHNVGKQFYRRVSGNFLDRRINYDLCDEPNAIAIAGMNRDVFEQAQFYNPQKGFEADMQSLLYELNTYFLNQRI